MISASASEIGSRPRICLSSIRQNATTGSPVRSEPKLGNACAWRPSTNVAIESTSAAVTTLLAAALVDAPETSTRFPCRPAAWVRGDARAIGEPADVPSHGRHRVRDEERRSGPWRVRIGDHLMVSHRPRRSRPPESRGAEELAQLATDGLCGRRLCAGAAVRTPRSQRGLRSSPRGFAPVHRCARRRAAG